MNEEKLVQIGESFGRIGNVAIETNMAIQNAIIEDTEPIEDSIEEIRDELDELEELL